MNKRKRLTRFYLVMLGVLFSITGVIVVSIDLPVPYKTELGIFLIVSGAGLIVGPFIAKN